MMANGNIRNLLINGFTIRQHRQLLIFLCLHHVVGALKCIQCSTMERNYRFGNNHNGKLDMTQCYEGKIEPRLCPNPNHTHCITYYFQSVYTQKMMVLWRKCGHSTDISHPCQIHDIESDTVMDLYDGAPGSYKRVRFRPMNQSLDRLSEHRRRSLVQVCVAGCTHDGCLVDSAICTYPYLRIVLPLYLVNSLIVIKLLG